MRNVLTVLAIWAAGLGAAAQFGKISVLYDLLAVRYGDHGAVALGLMVSVVGIVGLIFGTTAGILVARIGPRRAIVAACVLGVVAACGGLAVAVRGAVRVGHLAVIVAVRGGSLAMFVETRDGMRFARAHRVAGHRPMRRSGARSGGEHL